MDSAERSKFSKTLITLAIGFGIASIFWFVFYHLGRDSSPRRAVLQTPKLLGESLLPQQGIMPPSKTPAMAIPQVPTKAPSSEEDGITVESEQTEDLPVIAVVENPLVLEPVVDPPEPGLVDDTSVPQMGEDPPEPEAVEELPVEMTVSEPAGDVR